jgi:hypothetical protein
VWFLKALIRAVYFPRHSGSTLCLFFFYRIDLFGFTAYAFRQHICSCFGLPIFFAIFNRMNEPDVFRYSNTLFCPTSADIKTEIRHKTLSSPL